MSKNVDVLLRAIFSMNIKKVDAIELKNQEFGHRIGICSIGIGLTAVTKHKYYEGGGRSFFRYLYCLIWASFRYKKFSAFLNVNFFKQKTQFHELSIMNLNQWGHGVYAVKDAKFDDGLLDVIFMDKLKLVRLYWFSILILLGIVDDIQNAVNHHKTSFVSILLDDLTKVHIDGEPYEAVGEIEVSVLPRAVSVIQS